MALRHVVFPLLPVAGLVAAASGFAAVPAAAVRTGTEHTRSTTAAIAAPVSATAGRVMAALRAATTCVLVHDPERHAAGGPTGKAQPIDLAGAERRMLDALHAALAAGSGHGMRCFHPRLFMTVAGLAPLALCLECEWIGIGGERIPIDPAPLRAALPQGATLPLRP